MSNFTYWVCFTLVAFATIYSDFSSTLLHFGIQVPGNSMMERLETFGKLTPQMLTQHLPRELVQLIDQAVLLLVARRLWLLIFKRQGVPHSYVGVAKAFGYIGSTSVVFFVLGITFTIVTNAGFGVPAGMLLFLALVFMPWAFALAEATSFRRAPKRET